VAEWALVAELVPRDPALEHDLGVGRYLEVDRLRLDELDRLAPEEAGEHQLVDVLRQRRGGRVGGHGVEPERDRDRDAAVLGSESAIDFSFFRLLTFSTRPCGGCSSSTSSTRAATSSSRSTPSARHMRRSVPNWLMRSGWLEPFGCSNRSAGPPDFTVRSTIS